MYVLDRVNHLAAYCKALMRSHLQPGVTVDRTLYFELHSIFLSDMHFCQDLFIIPIS